MKKCSIFFCCLGGFIPKKREINAKLTKAILYITSLYFTSEICFNPIYHVRCWSPTHQQHFSFYIDIITPTWQKTKWQFTFKYIQGQKSFGFTFYYWKLSNFQISRFSSTDFFQNFQKFVRKINELKKGSLLGRFEPIFIWTEVHCLIPYTINSFT